MTLQQIWEQHGAGALITRPSFKEMKHGPMKLIDRARNTFVALDTKNEAHLVFQTDNSIPDWEIYVRPKPRKIAYTARIFETDLIERVVLVPEEYTLTEDQAKSFTRAPWFDEPKN